MRYFSALCARMYRLSANSRATISSTAIFLSQQSRQYRSSPRGSETSFAPHSAQRVCAIVFRDTLRPFLLERLRLSLVRLRLARSCVLQRPADAGRALTESSTQEPRIA